jgi:hypothetical protein
MIMKAGIPFTIISKCRGFTLVELLIVVMVLSTLVLVVVPSFSVGLVKSKGMQETQNLRSIEVAKASYQVESSGVDLSYVAQLEPYFPMGRVPQSPWGVAYEDVLNLKAVVRSQANGNLLMEPPVQPLDANGFNDLASPGYVYMNRSGPPEFFSNPIPPFQL